MVEQLFLIKACYRFTQYMADKLDKFNIKIWLAVHVKSKYILNAMPKVFGKDETRSPVERLSLGLVMRIIDPY